MTTTPNLKYTMFQLEQLRNMTSMGVQNTAYAAHPENSYDFLQPIAESDGFLNYVQYTPSKISPTKANAYFKSQFPQTSGSYTCTQLFKAGNVLRNFDYRYDNNAQFIIKMNAGDNVKYSSIGMGITDPHLSKTYTLASAQFGAYNEFFDILPYVMTDGVNSAGVYVGMNAVPRNDVQMVDINQDADEECCTLMLVRWILDNVDNIDDIEYELSKVHIYGSSYLDMGIHLLLANQYKSIVVEIENDHIEANYYPIMSNFRTNRGFDIISRRTRDYHADWSTVESNGAGLERWDICANFLKSKSTDFDTLRDWLKFSRSYTDIDESSYDTWLTDSGAVDGVLLDVNCAQDVHMNKKSSAYWTQFMNAMSSRNQMFQSRSRDAADTQHTVHAALYDIASRRFDLWIQERDDVKWTLSLN